MTSVVDTSVKLAWSGMANAPVLNGQAGSLLGVLDAALVTGFDIKPLASLTVANGIASATFAGQHSAQLDSVILIEGVTGALAHLNGEQKVTARPAANTLTFATACADGAATGAITLKMAPAGWARPYSGANKAAYTSADPQSLGMWLRVDDSTRNVRVIGYESMSDVDTGNGPFPSASMIAGGGYWNKSSQASAAAVPWVLAADSRLLLLWMATGLPSSTTATGGCVVAFGDPISYKPGGDAWAAILSFDTAIDQCLGGLESGRQSIATPRAYTGLGSSVWNGCYPYSGSTSAVSGADGALGAFPNPITGELHLSRRYVAANTNQPPRALLPGLHSVPQSGLSAYFKTGDVVPCAPPLAGRNLWALLINSGIYMTAVPNGVAFIDQTGPWR